MIRWEEYDPVAESLGFITPVGAILSEDGTRTVVSLREFAEVAEWLDSLPGERLFADETACLLLSRMTGPAAERGFTAELSRAVTCRLTDPAAVNRSVILPSTKAIGANHPYENLTGVQTELLGEGQFCFATVADGRILSAASENPRMGESIDIGVETAPGYENRGYAASNVAALVSALLRTGAPVTYTVEDTNPASLRVAEKVGFPISEQEMWIVFRKGGQTPEEKEEGEDGAPLSAPIEKLLWDMKKLFADKDLPGFFS